ncbi:thermonuclease family protein [Desulfovibrio sp. TomC]|uniref:thermonuclease family protein n=1 Tax=Desulfovibrio sp. TomC TaxID=1562888 RepID=UPI0005737539|nr:thermonuclease family protein [Desulfovibrio sp. TomC]KHK02745.1 hypothetical protein NY78_1695 [Desulfovibrio sp. TomC]
MRFPSVACLLLLLLWSCFGPALAGGPDFGQARGVVVRVCDGDTVVVDIPEYPDIIGKSIRVRLAGVDAPELRHRDPAVRQSAQAARQALAALLPAGTTVTLTQLKRDKYFRLDAVVLVDGRDAAAVLGLPPSR